MATLVFRGIRWPGKKTHVGICILLQKYLLFIRSPPSGFKCVYYKCRSAINADADCECRTNAVAVCVRHKF